ncbi:MULTISPECIES: hypothetical protein [Paenibacillus]|uniref:Uncharacterized protein n=1 Tax=Paenibacillus agri TaxID=2744309 RepID=A0A850EKT7_9BACL|nr:hypothetical protein [Paenibacillus agri]NUU59984.1 hypothetical protein [Paenibacillus agri]
MTNWIAFWKSNVMLEHPWVQPVYFVIIAFGLSFFTWFRKPRQERRKKPKD